MKALSLVLGLCITCTAVAHDSEFRQAVRQYRAGEWSGAYGRFVLLANEGHRDAARMALFMHQYGVLLYDSQWDASEEDVELWSRVAGRWPLPGEPERVSPAAAPEKPAWAARARMVPFQGRNKHLASRR